MVVRCGTLINVRLKLGLESIQLCACKYTYFGCSVTICDELVLADLSLETFKYRREFCKLKWYCKIKHTNDERLPFKLLSNEWNKVKSKGHPRNVGLPMLII